MRRNPRSHHALSLEAEQALIAAAQAGSRQATAMLVALEMPFLRSLARRLAHRIIHKNEIEADVDNMVSAGVAEFLRKIPRYDHRLARGIRLRSFTFLDVRKAMNRTACDSLESVRLPRESRIHRAHRDLEAGMTEEELRERHPTVPVAVLRSLHRSTVSIEQLREDEEIQDEDQDLAEDVWAGIEQVWERLDILEREVVTMRRLGLSAMERARRLGVTMRELRGTERRVLARVVAAVREREDDQVVDPLRCGFERRVWEQLTKREREVLTGLRLLVSRPLYERAVLLGVSPAQVRPVERSVVRRVRTLCC